MIYRPVQKPGKASPMWTNEETERLISLRAQYSTLRWKQFYELGFFPHRSVEALQTRLSVVKKLKGNCSPERQTRDESQAPLRIQELVPTSNVLIMSITEEVLKVEGDRSDIVPMDIDTDTDSDTESLIHARGGIQPSSNDLYSKHILQATDLQSLMEFSSPVQYGMPTPPSSLSPPYIPPQNTGVTQTETVDNQESNLQARIAHLEVNIQENTWAFEEHLRGLSALLDASQARAEYPLARIRMHQYGYGGVRGGTWYD
ncbi:SANT/Myb-like DNA-binding domain-containing protein [Aspergillus stella-maris]|uniref:SANT/Myb-like DNA-binding domain-containing protein n=1 Tax=Aspergillus stella-maris TaxID=1810926 RepID=UPI003CCDC0A0